MPTAETPELCFPQLNHVAWMNFLYLRVKSGVRTVHSELNPTPATVHSELILTPATVHSELILTPGAES